MSRLVQPIGANDQVVGPRDAPVTLVEYGDYACPFCGRAYRVLSEVLRRVGDSVLFAYRHFPLTQMHPRALAAAQAAEAAGAQDQFWSMHAMLFENQEALQPEDLLSYAEAIELDVVRFAEDLRSEIYLPKVRADFDSGVRSGVAGTPAFFINAESFDVPLEPEAIAAAIAHAA